MKKVIRGIVFLSLLSFTILTVYNVVKWKDTSGDYLSATNQLYSTEEELIDIVFLGSSHGYCGIVPDALWEQYGYSAFNLSTSGQDKNATYYLLKELLKTQSPKVVCVELWGLTYDGYIVEGNLHRNMLALRLSKNAVELLETTVEDEKQKKDYLLRWPIVHTRYKELTKYDFIPNEYSEYGRSVPISGKVGAAWYSEEIVQSEEIGILTESNSAWIENLHQLSKEEGFELIFFMTPTTLELDDQKQVNAVAAYAKENNLAFFDFNKLRLQTSISTETDFVDATHLNFSGAKKITKYIGEYIDENIELEDHRGDEAYYQWVQSYDSYCRQQEVLRLIGAANINEYAEALQETKDITYVIAVCGDYKTSTLDIKGILEVLGLPKAAYEEGGIYVGMDGKVELAVENNSSQIYTCDLNDMDSFKLWNAGIHKKEATNLDNIMLNLDSYGSVYNGINVVVYDNASRKIIDKRGYF